MYKTLIKKIKELEIEKNQERNANHRTKIQEKINKFKDEMERIQSMFPVKFFEGKT